MKTLSPYPEYKDSGVEWLGEIPAHWQVERLKYAVHLNPDTLPETTDPDYALQYLDIGNVEEVGGVNPPQAMHFADAPSRARRRVLSGDTIISTVRTYLKAIAHFENPPDNLIVSTGFAVLRPTAQVAPRFLHALVRCGVFVEKVVAHSVGVGYPAINPTELSCLPVWLPPLDEQHAIAEFLDRETARIDGLVAKKERLIALLQEKRTALVSHAVTKGLNPNAPMKDSGIEWLGQIPAHWEVKELKYAIQPRAGAIKTGPFGSQLLASEMTDGLVKVFNQRNVIDRNLSAGDNYITESKFNELRAFEVFPDDVLVTTRGTIGRCAIVPPKSERGILHPCLMRVQCHPERLRPAFLSALVEDSGLILEQLLLLSNATTIEVIYSDTLRRVAIPTPPVHEQEQIVIHIQEETAKLGALMAKVRTAIERLQEYRTALISAAVTGKIDVRGQTV